MALSWTLDFLSLRVKSLRLVHFPQNTFLPGLIVSRSSLCVCTKTDEPHHVATSFSLDVQYTAENGVSYPSGYFIPGFGAQSGHGEYIPLGFKVRDKQPPGTSTLFIGQLSPGAMWWMISSSVCIWFCLPDILKWNTKLLVLRHQRSTYQMLKTVVIQSELGLGGNRY